MARILDITSGLDVSLSLERSRLVGLCARLTGNADIAEDLAQETLLEAWRHLNELRDQEKFTQWLSGIARNVCLRWMRKHGRDATHTIELQPDAGTSLAGLEDWLSDDFDLEVELERKELIELLDRALALLPAETRAVLIERYVQESPITEVAARLGINTSAAAMRLQRGKLALRSVLAREFGRELASYELARLDPASADSWEETPLWCTICGQHRLKGRYNREKGEIWFTCPVCCPAPRDFLMHTDMSRVLVGVKGYKPALSRMYAWDHNYYRPNLSARTIPCPACGRPTELQRGPSEHPSLSPWHRNRHGIFHQCDRCTPANYCWESLEFMVLALPEGRRFQQEHPRIRSLPHQEVEVDGRAALVTTFESVTNTDRFVVISARDTYELLRIV